MGVRAAAEALEWSPSLLKRVLGEGEGSFWVTDRKRRRLFLTSPKGLAKRFGVVYERSVFWIPVQALAGKLGTVRANLAIRSIAAVRHGRPISYQSMAEMCRVDVRTAKRWKRIANLKIRKNFETIGLVGRIPLKELSKGAYKPGLAIAVVKRRGVPYRLLVRRLPNAFPAQSTDKSTMGSLTVNPIRVRRRLNSAIRQGMSLGHGDERNFPTYWLAPAFRRRKRNAEERQAHYKLLERCRLGEPHRRMKDTVVKGFAKGSMLKDPAANTALDPAARGPLVVTPGPVGARKCRFYEGRCPAVMGSMPRTRRRVYETQRHRV